MTKTWSLGALPCEHCTSEKEAKVIALRVTTTTIMQYKSMLSGKLSTWVDT